MQISGKCIDFLGFQKKKKKKNLYPFWFYVILNIAFLKETKVHMEYSVIFGLLFLQEQTLYFKQNLILQYDHIKCNTSF